MSNSILDQYGNPIRKIQEKETKENKETTKKLFTQIPIIFTVGTFVLIVLSGISSIFIYNYYGISLNLFTYDVSKLFIILFKYFSIWSGLIGIGIFFYQINRHGVLCAIFKIFVTTIFYFIILIFTYNELIDLFVTFNLKGTLSNCFVIIGYFGMSIPIFFIRKDFLHSLNLIFKKLNNVKEFFCNIYLFFMILIAVIFYSVLLSFTINSLLTMNPHTKTNYETIMINNKEKVVLFHVNNKLFISDYYTDKDNNKTTIFTKHYKVIEFSNVEFTNVEFENVVINKVGEPPISSS